jgi:hypothetical protein
MSDQNDIDHVLRDWPFQPGGISARLVRAGDGRDVLQMRLEMGLLQMETTHRPDGEKPGGADTYLDHLIQEAVHWGERFQLSEQQCLEVDREFLQFYHRRVCWMAIGEFERAVGDADHTLDLMDFVRDHSPDEPWVRSHEQYRPLVLFHRTQACAFGQLDKQGAERAIEEINAGLERIREAFADVDGGELLDEESMAQQLRELQQAIREHYEVGRTLSEQLADAVADEQYELAARLRDEIARRRFNRP